MVSILFIVIAINILLVGSESYAQPTTELVVNPDRYDIPAGSEPIVLTAKASGSSLKFEWELLGPGEFEGKTDRSAIFYKPPKQIESDSAYVTITVTVTDKNGDQATASVTFNITQKVDSTPTTQPTPSPIPSGDGGKVQITSLKNGDIVDAEERVKGAYNTEIQEDIWVFVYPKEIAGKCWPQSDNPKEGTPANKKDGIWFQTCWFSGSKNFDIVVYTATPSASRFIGDTLKEWFKANDYEGFFDYKLQDEPLNGLIEKHRITVTTKDF